RCQGTSQTKGLPCIGLLQQLKHLNVSRSGDYAYNKITDVGLVSIAALSQLQSLELRYCNQVTDAGLVNIAALSQLQFLNLSGCDQITSIHDISSLQQLRGLALNDCKIMDAGIASIGSLHQLQRLTLRCTRITDAGIVIVASLKQLQVLDVDGCTSITDATLVIVALMPQLQLLGLDCNQFDFDHFDFRRLVLVQNQQVQLWHGDWNCYNVSHVPDDF
ncbi:receptor-type protein kinase, putative, partial [Bodo saltans]